MCRYAHTLRDLAVHPCAGVDTGGCVAQGCMWEGESTCMYLVRGQGEWAVYKGNMAGMFGEFVMFKTKL